MTIEFPCFLIMYLLTLKILTIGFAGSYHAYWI